VIRDRTTKERSYHTTDGVCEREKCKPLNTWTRAWLALTHCEDEAGARCGIAVVKAILEGTHSIYRSHLEENSWQGECNEPLIFYERENHRS
jgi:hypothetical protein